MDNQSGVYINLMYLGIFYFTLIFILGILLFPSINKMLKSTRESWKKWWRERYDEYKQFEDKNKRLPEYKSSDENERSLVIWVQDTKRLMSLGELPSWVMYRLVDTFCFDYTEEDAQRNSKSEHVFQEKYSTSKVNLIEKVSISVLYMVFVSLVLFISRDADWLQFGVFFITTWLCLAAAISDLLCRTVDFKVLGALCLLSVPYLVSIKPVKEDVYAVALIVLVVVFAFKLLKKLLHNNGNLSIGKTDILFCIPVMLFALSGLKTFEIASVVSLIALLITVGFRKLTLNKDKTSLIPLVPFLSGIIILQMALNLICG